MLYFSHDPLDQRLELVSPMWSLSWTHRRSLMPLKVACVSAGLDGLQLPHTMHLVVGAGCSLDHSHQETPFPLAETRPPSTVLEQPRHPVRAEAATTMAFWSQDQLKLKCWEHWLCLLMWEVASFYVALGILYWVWVDFKLTLWEPGERRWEWYSQVILQQEVEEITWREKGRTRSESGLCFGALYNASFPLLPYSGLLFDASRIF